MVAKTGVARLALTTGAPVIPVAHWGTQEILPYGSKKVRLFPRKTVRTVAGPPVDLSQWADQRMSASTLRAATAAIMKEVTAIVAQLRGEEPPAIPFDPNLASRTDGIAPPAPSPPPAEVASADGAGNPDGGPGNPERERGNPEREPENST
jgi:hypothetical protein